MSSNIHFRFGNWGSWSKGTKITFVATLLTWAVVIAKFPVVAAIFSFFGVAALLGREGDIYTEKHPKNVATPAR